MSADESLAARLLLMLTDIGIIDQLIATAATRALAPALGLSEYSLLNHLLRRGDGTPPGRLAKAFQVSKPSMTMTVGRLAHKGFVRVDADKDDGRAKRVFLTEAGRTAHQAARGRLSALEDELFAGYDIAALLEHAHAIAGLRAHLDGQRNIRDGLA
ncbi:MAG: MarR family transcriptional regulator [Sphingopyxis sp.]|nr:MarR family transcriptional regulator [Sphingopyxis sp.]